MINMRRVSVVLAVVCILAAEGCTAAGPTGGAAYPYDANAAIKLSDKFKRLKAPGTGRRAIQLTWGKGTCYPLYYFIPSLTRDMKYLVHHRAEAGQVQLHRLNLQTGESV